MPAKVAIVGEAPGAIEDRKGGPFLGPAGALLTSTLKANKVRPEQCFYCNVVSCFPKLERKTPTKEHISRCAGNLKAQLDLSQAEFVLCVGGIAYEALAPWFLWAKHPRKISYVHGRPWDYQNRKWMACVHPAAALRHDKYMDLFKKDIKSFVSMIKDGPVYSDECYACDDEVVEYGEQGMGWCKLHRRG